MTQNDLAGTSILMLDSDTVLCLIFQVSLLTSGSEHFALQITLPSSRTFTVCLNLKGQEPSRESH